MKKQIKKEEKSSKFLSGALIGAALGVAAGLFATSKTGKEMSGEVKNKMAEFYKTIAPQLKKAQKMGEQEYKAFVKNAALKYNKNKTLSDGQVNDLIKEAHSSWKHLKKHL